MRSFFALPQSNEKKKQFIARRLALQSNSKITLTFKQGNVRALQATQRGPSWISKNQGFSIQGFSIQIHQIFHYTHCITPKCVTSWRSPSLIIAPGTTASFAEMSQLLQAVDNIKSNLTVLRYESQTNRSKNKLVTAWPTGW